MKQLLVLFLMLSGCATQQQQSKVLFLCPYGGAKSVIAASYFNRLAAERDLPFVAIAAAAETPYDAVPTPVADALERDGLDVRSFQPRQVQADDLRSAERVISIDCDLTKLDAHGATIERWDDVPRVSADLPGSVAAIRRHVEALVMELGARAR
jgi:arsenate reductase (thioredoxin)